MMLALLAALASAMTVGIFDHYFFNITFPHMTALFWIVCGIILALSKPVAGEKRLNHVSKSTQNHQADAV